MNQPLHIYNTLTKTKELFKPINAPLVGMYVCGPTVYSDAHLGNCRTFTSFDIIYRYLLHLGYKVRYVRNITDAGHLEGDRDMGDDKFTKKAKEFALEPMEIVQKYTIGFRDIMRLINNLPPSIEPTATGHILEQQDITKQIINNGLAYEANGTVYFDVDKYAKLHNYTELTNRKLEELYENTRDLEGQSEKKGRLDFALWIKAKPEHLMKWNSPWGVGFPGWHIECSAMSHKYLGYTFDIHGGGMDLQATHHTNEIAQNMAFCGKKPANYWIHTNMLTVNGQKMSKSLGNSFLPMELFSGQHPLLSKGFNPIVVRFFMLQAHYRSTLDFSNDALEAAEKGFKKLKDAFATLNKLTASNESSVNIKHIKDGCYAAMNDDFNTPMVIAHFFTIVKIINAAQIGNEKLTSTDIEQIKQLYKNFIIDIMGLQVHTDSMNNDQTLNQVMELVLELRQQAKLNKDYTTSDLIRDKITNAHIQINDSKDGSNWVLK